MAIVSHTHKFVIVRPPKTGSSSFHASVVESGILSDDDVYSRLNKVIVDGADPHLYRHWIPYELERNHYLTEEQLYTYTTVATIRHPIDRYISTFFFNNTIRKRPTDLVSFKNLIRSKDSKKFDIILGPKQSKYLTVFDKLLKNLVVIPIERLDECLENFIDKYNGKVIKHELKSNFKPDWAKLHYSEWLSDEDIKILKVLLIEEIEIYYHVRANNEYQF